MPRHVPRSLIVRFGDARELKAFLLDPGKNLVVYMSCV